MKIDISKFHACHAYHACHTNSRMSKYHANSRGGRPDHSGPRTPPEPVQYHTCHTCPTKWRLISPRVISQSAIPAIPTAAAAIPAKARHRSQPNAIYATAAIYAIPVIQSKGRCRHVPCLPHKTKVDVTKCHTCHARPKRATGASPMPYIPRRKVPYLPRQQPRRPPRPLRPTLATGASPIPYVPYLPNKVKSPRPLRPKPATGANPISYVPCLPYKMKIDVTKYHTCHVKPRWLSQSTTPATPTAAAATPATPAQTHHRSQPNVIRTTPTTQNEDRCHQVSRLPRKTKVAIAEHHAYHANSRGGHPGHSGPSAPPEPAQCHMYHACLTKWRLMSPCTTPAK